MENVKVMGMCKMNYLHESFVIASKSTCSFRVTGISGATSALSFLSSWWSCSVNNLSTNSMIEVVTDGWLCARSRRFIIYGNGVKFLFPLACFAKSTKYLKLKLLCVLFTASAIIFVTVMQMFGFWYVNFDSKENNPSHTDMSILTHWASWLNQ